MAPRTPRTVIKAKTAAQDQIEAMRAAGLAEAIIDDAMEKTGLSAAQRAELGLKQADPPKAPPAGEAEPLTDMVKDVVEFLEFGSRTLGDAQKNTHTNLGRNMSSWARKLKARLALEKDAAHG